MFADLISREIQVAMPQVERTIRLLDDGATIPFIARYRKEATGSLDETVILKIQQRLHHYQALEKRKTTILQTIGSAGQLTPELETSIRNCWDEHTLEDIYLPYKPKRKTRAAAAKEKGLEPLARILMAQQESDPEKAAARFVKGEVSDTGEALQGARDIMAEWISEHGYTRNRLRGLFRQKALVCTTVARGKAEEGVKYRDYFDFEEPLRKIPSHRILAVLRGEDEGMLNLSIQPEKEEALQLLHSVWIKNTHAASQVQLAIKDAYQRLLQPSMQSEFRDLLKQRADEDAIRVFADNLRQLLLAPPLGHKRILAIDPGFRTGCKLVCLDEGGNLLHNETIYPHPPQSDVAGAARKVRSLAEAYKTEAIAIGNGTAGRETEEFIQRKVKFDHDLKVYVVSENGASVYSASAIAREEFPTYDVTVRGAVSIGRRLADPLAELVKIDPKSIGVGQYQHDVNQQQLKQSLDEVVESCVNAVGVNLNSASKYLLTYVSGIGPQLAEQIVAYRREHGLFTTRDQLRRVPRLGPRAFEQAAGFLRIEGGDEPLDNTAVHPENYELVRRMARDLGLEVAGLIRKDDILDGIKLERYVSGEVGLPTLQDIIQELKKPGRDPRKSYTVMQFSRDVRSIADLQPGMVLPGIVTNITHFGAFVDVGVKQDGLVHISQLADRFISNPHDVVKMHQQVKVKVVEVDVERKRIQLTMKDISG